MIGWCSLQLEWYNLLHREEIATIAFAVPSPVHHFHSSWFATLIKSLQTMPFALPHCHTYRTHVYPSNIPMYSTLFSGRIAQIVFVAQSFKSGRIDQSGAIYRAMNSSAALCSPFNKYPVRRSSVQRELCFTENFVQPDTPPPACLLHSHHPPPPVILQDIQRAHLSKNRRYDPKNNYCYLSQTTSIGDLSVCLCLSVGCALFTNIYPPPR